MNHMEDYYAHSHSELHCDHCHESFLASILRAFLWSMVFAEAIISIWVRGVSWQDILKFWFGR